MSNDAMNQLSPAACISSQGVVGRSVESPAERSGVGGLQHYARCPVCHDRAISPKANNLTICDNCRHVFQSDRCISMVYDASYARQYDHRPHREMSQLRWEYIQHHLTLRRGSKVLDIGYGNGAFLKQAQRDGMEIFGIDLHGEGFDIPEVRYDSPIDYDLVCFFDSIEHFVEFDEIFALNTEHVITSTPDTPELLLSQPYRWRHYKPGEHLHYFSHGSLDLLIRRWGLTHKVAEGHPEDAIRGKLTIDGRIYDNIYTVIYSRDGVRTAR